MRGECNMKRMLSIILLCVLSLTVFPFSTYAEETSEKDVENKSGYYLVGNITDWKPASSYKLKLVPNEEGITEFSISVTLSENDRFKIAYSEDGLSTQALGMYPDGMGNDLSVTHGGYYTVSFRPNYDGEEDWIAMGSDPAKKVISIASEAGPGYHIVGTKTDWKISPYSFLYGLKKNDYAEVEEYYSLLQEFKKGEEFVIVHTLDGVSTDSFYPNEKNKITIEKDGYYTVIFRPNGDGEQDWISMGSDPEKYVVNLRFEHAMDQAPTVFPMELPIENLYKDKFLEVYPEVNLTKYQELFYHKDKNGEIDWSLITAYSNLVSPMPIYYEVGNRIIYGFNDYSPFVFGCGIYDVKKGQFFDIVSVDLNDYEGLEEQFNQTNFGRLIGDTDKDNKISILDATIIQRRLAGIQDITDDIVEFYSESAGGKVVKYYSDYDRDGVRSVLDATHIQKHLAGME